MSDDDRDRRGHDAGSSDADLLTGNETGLGSGMLLEIEGRAVESGCGPARGKGSFPGKASRNPGTVEYWMLELFDRCGSGLLRSYASCAYTGLTQAALSHDFCSYICSAGGHIEFAASCFNADIRPSMVDRDDLLAMNADEALYLCIEYLQALRICPGIDVSSLFGIGTALVSDGHI